MTMEKQEVTEELSPNYSRKRKYVVTHSDQMKAERKKRRIKRTKEEAVDPPSQAPKPFTERRKNRWGWSDPAE